MRRLDQLGEDGWIARLVRRLGPATPPVLVGPGDDAAALRVGGTTLLVTTDTLVEGVHFRPGWLTPAALGRRAFGVNASDIAAMGGRPLAAVLALEVVPATQTRALDGLVAGFVAAARRHRVALVGGNVTRGSHLAITVTMLGVAARRVVTRAGARAGDHVFVTGTLGAAGLAVRARLAGRGARLPEVPDRVAAGAMLAGVASAMIDLSDGLVRDLGHVCRASGVGARVDAERLPILAACRRTLGGAAAAFAATAGEDYELCFTLPPARRPALDRLRARLRCHVTPIGVIEAGPPTVRLVDAHGRTLRLARTGFDHLRRR